MISVDVDGIADVVASLRAIASKARTSSSVADVGQDFASRLRAATPVGYSGKLRDSVVYSETDDGVDVGYEEGVETAGEARLDSVLSVSTKGKSVIRRKQWAKASELESIMQETFDSFASEAATVLEERLLSGIS